MQKKNILVIGVKTLGMSLVKQLSNYNCEILAIDKDMKRVEEADKALKAYYADQDAKK